MVGTCWRAGGSKPGAAAPSSSPSSSQVLDCQAAPPLLPDAAAGAVLHRVPLSAPWELLLPRRVPEW